MAGTITGGKKAAETNMRKHGVDFYKRIGAIGGKRGHYGGFNDPEVARRAGTKGGRLSKKGTHEKA